MNCQNCQNCGSCQNGFDYCGALSANNCRYPKNQCQGIPVDLSDCPEFKEPTEICCDCGGCKEYPKKCRNRFWPSFAHPRWLCCCDLYCAR